MGQTVREENWFNEKMLAVTPSAMLSDRIDNVTDVLRRVLELLDRMLKRDIICAEGTETCRKDGER